MCDFRSPASERFVRHKFLFENEGFPDDFRKTFLVYLISHQRSMSELLNPHRKDIKDLYENEFVCMSQLEVSVENWKR